VPRHVLKVESLTFTLLSHDQGFSDWQEQYRGTYTWCFSYFEVFVSTLTGHDRVRPRTLQANRHATIEPFKHTITWTYADADPDLRAWLSAIRGGDTVQVVPQARFVAWRNFVYEAEIVCTGTIRAERSHGLTTTLQLADDARASLYSPLDSDANEIRVLRLFPCTGQDIVRCQLLHVPLQHGDIIQYECLSYCWGDTDSPKHILVCSCKPDQTHAITFDECKSDACAHPLPVTSNLHAALQSVRPEKGKTSHHVGRCDLHRPEQRRGARPAGRDDAADLHESLERHCVARRGR